MVSETMKKLKPQDDEKISWFKSMPFILFHLSPIGLFFVEVTIGDVIFCFGFYYARMFFISAGYHRYFAHRSYKMTRFWQFLMGLGGTLALQKGPLWWASYHRMHHKYSDTENDVHSPKRGFFWSHIGWILCSKYNAPLYDKINDFAKYPELRWLDNFYAVPPILAGALIWYWGGAGAFFMGCLSTILLYHGTFVINSLAHLLGTRRYATSDTSRNSLLLALITCGEGWHNNHHHFQVSARQGFRWWEIDLSYYVLKILSVFKVVTELKIPSDIARKRRLIADGCFDEGMFNAYYEKALGSIDHVKSEAKTIYEKKQVALAQLMDQTKAAADELASISYKRKIQLKAHVQSELDQRIPQRR
jgi:stearoyl-CoA desaturase (Delta-9 desaturase)